MLHDVVLCTTEDIISVTKLCNSGIGSGIGQQMGFESLDFLLDAMFSWWSLGSQCDQGASESLIRFIRCLDIDAIQSNGPVTESRLTNYSTVCTWAKAPPAA